MNAIGQDCTFSRRNYDYWRQYHPGRSFDGTQPQCWQNSATEAAKLARAEQFMWEHPEVEARFVSDDWDVADCDCSCKHPDRNHGKGRWKPSKYDTAYHHYTGTAVTIIVTVNGQPVDSLGGIFASEIGWDESGRNDPDAAYWERWWPIDQVAENMAEIIAVLGLEGEPLPDAV